MNVLGIAILTGVLSLVAFGSRRVALLGVMAGVLYLTEGEQVVVVGFHIFALRFIELVGFIRVIVRKDLTNVHFNVIDKLILLLYTYTTVVFLLRSRADQIYQVGIAVDALLSYFTFRALISNFRDFIWFLKLLVLLLGPYVGLLLLERYTGNNPFYSMGGVVLSGEHWTRGGVPRCQGSFRHASLLGTLGATFLPLYIALFVARTDRVFAAAGTGLCLAIVWASNSGGPANCAAIAVVGWLFWRMRRRMKLIRRIMLLFIVVMAVFMKAPIWYLPAKASSLTGGDGWHRSFLMDTAIKSIGQWWLAGMPISETADWFPYTIQITGAADITNAYLSFGISAGLPAMIFFVSLLVLSFKQLGRAMLILRESFSGSTLFEYILWGLGVTLTTHLFNWFGINYFDQSYAIWFLQLAALATLSDETNLLRFEDDRLTTDENTLGIATPC